MSTVSAAGWQTGFRADFESIFVKTWSPFVGAIHVATGRATTTLCTCRSRG